MSSEEVQKTYRFLEHLTRKYYQRAKPILPDDFVFREFALQRWGVKGYIRHIGATSKEQVYRLLVEKAPRHFYYSSARYDNPAADNMDAKGWRSADLTFDIDADHLPECSDSIVEVESPVEGKVTLIDEVKCIPKAALRARILYDILVYELGVERGRIAVEFSGHRGFHITVYLSDEDELAKADSEVRREIVNYINAVGLKEETLKPWLTLSLRRGKPLPVLPTVKLAGVRGRLARIARLLAVREGNIEAVKAFERVGGVVSSSIEELISKAEEYVSVGIDEQVTIDTKRLIRAPMSIHGKTGMLVKPIKVDDLDSFNVSEDLSAFRDYDSIRVRILVDVPPTVTIVGNRVRLRKGDQPRLPAPVAVYFMAKGLAVLAR